MSELWIIVVWKEMLLRTLCAYRGVSINLSLFLLLASLLWRVVIQNPHRLSCIANVWLDFYTQFYFLCIFLFHFYWVQTLNDFKSNYSNILSFEYCLPHSQDHITVLSWVCPEALDVVWAFHIFVFSMTYFGKEEFLISLPIGLSKLSWNVMVKNIQHFFLNVNKFLLSKPSSSYV